MNIQAKSTISLTKPEDILRGMKTWLIETLGDSADFMIPELAEMFLEDTPTLKNAIQTGIKEKDAKQVREAAHTLKGSSASMGLHGFSGICKEIETNAKAGNLQAATNLLPVFQAEYEQVISVLQTVVE